MYRILQVFFLLFFSGTLLAQSSEDNQDIYQLPIRRTGEAIKVDGLLSEAVWKETAVAGDFWEKWPKDQDRSKIRTEFRMTYDDNFIYVAATCYDTIKQHIIQSLKRDVDFFDSDGVFVVLDPVNERTNGFMFAVSPLGVQSEALISMTGGDDPVNADWDNKWFAEAKDYEDHWVVEMAIPFKTLRYEENKSTWGVSFLRGDAKRNFYYSWTPIPIQFWGVHLGYTGSLIWDESPKKTKGNISIIPYTKAEYFRDFEEGDETDRSIDIGLDAKISVSSSLNLDLTINPDFSQVEVDEQVQNLSRFSLFFPEKRTFFLENSDIFAAFGIPPVRPFFSRRIGLTEDGEAVPILFGLRLSGNLDKNWRIGLMNMHTKGIKAEDLPEQNYTALAFNRKLFARSVLKGNFLNRQSFNGTEVLGEDYSRNASLEFNYASKDGRWMAWSGYNHSFKPDITNKNYFFNIGFAFEGRKMSVVQDFLNMGDNYYADMGFIARIENYDAERDTTIRLGLSQPYTNITFRHYVEDHEKINFHWLTLENVLVYNPDGSFNERSSTVSYSLGFKNTSMLEFGVEDNDVRLLFPFDFVEDATPLPKARYRFTSARLSYNSDARKAFSYAMELGYGSFYNGDRRAVSAELSYRQQPWGNFGLRFAYNDIQLPEDYGDIQLYLISPRVEISFSKNLFWTTFLQYNTQAENFNVNSRIQWRYRSMSDIFLVYTDNYLVESNAGQGISLFAPKNKAIVLKANYWLNL